MAEKLLQTRYSLALRLRSVYLVARGATPFDIGWSLLLYYLALVLVTDCFLWYSSGSLAGYQWKTLVVYSLLSYPLWMLIGLKGIGRQQSDLMEQAKWHAVDLLPGGPTAIFLGHHVGKVLKTKALYVWAIAFLSLAIYHQNGPLEIGLAVGNIVIGSINLVLGGIIFRFYSPKGYSGLVGSIFHNTTWILSGAVFPLGMLSTSPWFYLLNPFSAAVSTPLNLLQEERFPGALSKLDLQLYTFAGCILWMFLFGAIAMYAERSRREKCY
ncbi:hypothetical protein [Tumebacillus lipolyticus]|uniref:ABC-2 type transporter domain-containing protein n=1 Tax=Tumebacillus lipolyticus TaxID=1280370 RepID=A0ABW5A495_9BACL